MIRAEDLLTLPELLAPAGNLLSGVTALDCGADAVYAGLKQFNARERTENFSETDLIKLVRYAHGMKRKVYVALNTLIKDSELDAVAETLAFLTDLGPDGVIIQDLGIVHLVRNCFPDLPLHASTQMGIHNAAGLQVAADLGIKRVILERQVTLEEMERMVPKSPVEVEVFVHGALCCSLSGVCLFSSWAGKGASGNRGKCMQLCRRRFRTVQSGKPGMDGYFFSPRDLCLIEQVPDLIRIGVRSLKIEGRLRKPDYVAAVVTAYRQVLDAPDHQRPEAVKEAGELLETTAAREWSRGFLTRQSMKSLIQSERPGVAGRPCAEIMGIQRDGIRIRLLRRLHVGDKVRAQNEGGEASSIITVTSLRGSRDRMLMKAEKGTVCLIPVRDPDIPKGSLLYKTGESYRELTRKLAAIPDSVPVTLDLKIRIDGNMIHVEVIQWNETWQFREELQSARQRPLETEIVCREFSASCSDHISAGNIQVRIDGNWFLPLSRMKEVRRQFWQWAGERLESGKDISAGTIGLAAYHRLRSLWTVPPTIPNPSTTICGPLRENESGPQFRRCVPIEKFTLPADEVMLPFFCPEDSSVKQLLASIHNVYRQGIRRFRITSLYQFTLLKKFTDLQLVCSFPLPVSNSAAAVLLAEFPGVESVQAWVELEKPEMLSMVHHSPVPVERFRNGFLPLLATRARIPVMCGIADSHHETYRIEQDPITGLTLLIPDIAMELPDDTPELAQLPQFEDRRRYSSCLSSGKRETGSTFNYSGLWK